MAEISVRDLDEDVAARLTVRAARHGRSMEAEVRAILTGAVAQADDECPNLAQAIRLRFAALGGAELRRSPRLCRSQATLATRNTGDFDGTGIGLIDPWN